MIQVGDQLKGIAPREFYETDEKRKDGRGNLTRLSRPSKAVVEYVHPKGRFATIRFFYAFGSFCESRSLYRGELT